MDECSPRVVVWFSCGATSAVAAKLAFKEYGPTHNFHVAYCDTQSEHPDNRRFFYDVQDWVGHPFEILRSSEYNDIWDVWRKTRWLIGPKGARCTTELKKRLRFQYQQPGDLQVFGFDHDEAERADNLRKNNPEVNLITPLIERGLSKPDCLAMLERAGIEPPAMYRLGFPNANCIGCVKGTMTYWNHVRRVFPETFNAMARLERELNVAINKTYAGDGKRKRVFLDELDPDAGRGEQVVLPECGLLCAAAEVEIEKPSAIKD